MTPVTAEDLHRHHAGHDPLAKGWRVDLLDGAWRYDGSLPIDLKAAMAYRLAICWNLCEGIPTARLLDGVIADFYTEARELAAAIRRGATNAEIRARGAKLERADLAHGFTSVDCKCGTHGARR